MFVNHFFLLLDFCVFENGSKRVYKIYFVATRIALFAIVYLLQKPVLCVVSFRKNLCNVVIE